MSINEIVDTYMRHCHMRRVQGTGGDPILPFFMLDAMYQILKRDLWPVESRHEAKRERTLWLNSYNALNRDFFSAFNDDQRDYIIDLMDSFEEHINNDVLITQVAVMNQLGEYKLSFEDQKIVSSAMLCHILAQTAKITWNAIYKTKHCGLRANAYLDSILKHSSRWMNLYFSSKSDAHINPNDNQQICTAVDILCKKMVNFISTIE